MIKNPFSLGKVFFYKLTKNPNLTIFFSFFFFFFFFFGGGGGGGGLSKGMGWGGGGGDKCTYMNKCFKWYFYCSRKTPVQNYFEIHAYI